MTPDSPTTTPAVDIRSLRVDYGDFVAVDDLTLAIPRGEVFGLVGPNGAGKTSTFKVITTLMEPTYGEVFLDGVDIQENLAGARRLLGYMPDLAPVPGDLRVWEFLDFHADAYGLGGRAARRERVAECLEKVALTPQRNSWCKKLSRGQTQRVVLAKTLLHRPTVLVLDEPASGLDPLARRDLRNVLRELAAGGATVFVSSHILTELAEMCTSLCVMNRGRLLASGTVDEVRNQLGNDSCRLSAVLSRDRAGAEAWLRARPEITGLSTAGERLEFAFHGDEAAQEKLLADFIAAGFRPRTFEERRSSFEDMLVGVAEGRITE